ncbi:SPOR domain-containing protein [Aeromonas rivipollensis]|uniref:SPOR domain-containing protein n=1 Tax=Aeromonas rivipollensis TaxID=948519 RepID=UPI00259ED8B1|nr:SPOR domain-containing protein [Aeromonas rivipollensis]MDM5084405.1 SPOR domain-containing protein [Aeromonas rivipollensis]MDM5096476.1 SPOR domain-containing protein [Aeromonas rivipollensis]MDM5105297.1 SPOR domain-containing protein [Aeromonas rivipollensis]
MTECHLPKCNPASLIRQIGIGLAAGALCLLVLSYVSPARQSASETAPAPAEASSPQSRTSGAAATARQGDEASFLLPALTAGADGEKGEGMTAGVTVTPMMGEPSAAVFTAPQEIAAQEKVAHQPPMGIPASLPPAAPQPAAKAAVPSEPVPRLASKPAPTSESKPAIKPAAKAQATAPGKVSLTPAKVLQQKNGNHLSVQLMGSRSLAAIEQFVLANQLAGQVWVYQTRFNGSPWYVVLKGEYAGMSQAQAAIRTLSPALQKADPWPKSFAQVKRELQQ